MYTKLKLSEIWLYPIKSLGGVRVQSAKVLGKGLLYDRRYMLVDESSQFMTQRTSPLLALFKFSISDNGFTVAYKGDSIELPFQPQKLNGEIKAVVWDDTVKANVMDDPYNRWFSDRIGKPCRLVYFPEENRRPVDEKFAKNDEQVSLADGYPFLIIGQSSLDDLNGRLEVPLPMNRFRPNFVFEGGKPFEEDSWRNFMIGNNRFVGLKPCARCIIPTINQDTAEQGTEPLKTMAGFRKRDGKVYFGQNLVAIDHHQVHEGDEIRVESYQ